MKTIIAICAVLFCGVALADEAVSVLNHNQPTTAPVAAAPAPSAPAAEAAPAEAAPAQRCENSQCRLKTYTAHEQSHDFTRRRLLGGYVVRKGSRTVLRPTR